jgi:hypothetical protein
MADLKRKDCRGRKGYEEIGNELRRWCCQASCGVLSKAGQRRGDLRAMSRQPRI